MKTRFATLSLVALLLMALSSCGGGSGSSSQSSVTGKPGSLSRFTISGDRLYTIDGGDLMVFDISHPADPVKLGRGYVGEEWDLETISSHQGLLLIGCSSGLYIYDTVNPDRPHRVSRMLHAQSYDPVVARDNTVFLTLSGTQNQLDVIDITDPATPTLLRSYPMTSPKGLGIDGNYLFVCDGSDGVKVIDSSEPLNLYEVDRTRDLMPMDLIVNNKLLVATTQGGISQYSYNTLPMTPLSLMSYHHDEIPWLR